MIYKYWIIFILLVHAGTKLTELQKSSRLAAFYLLYNGRDYPDCGANETSACYSFSFVLEIFFNESKTLNETILPILSVTTDETIHINNQLLAKFPLLSGLKITLDSFANATNASLVLDSVFLQSSSYKTNGINILIVNSTMVDCELHFEGAIKRQMSDRILEKSVLFIEYGMATVACLNSQLFGTEMQTAMSISISSGRAYFDNVVVSEANQSVPVIQLTNFSSVLFNNSHFMKNSILHQNSTGLILVKQSHLVLENCSFQNNVGQNGGVFYVHHGSKVQASGCTFSGNHATMSAGVMFARLDVEIKINECSFSHNTARYNSGVTFSTEGTNFQIFKSNFTTNSANISDGGCFSIANDNNYTIDSCKFVANSVGQSGTIIFARENNVLNIKNSDFLDNTSDLTSAILEVSQNADINFKDCKFIGNRALLSQSTISIYNKVTLKIDSCIFDNNTSEMVGIIEAKDNVSVTVLHTAFFRNSAAETSLISVGANTLFSFDSCSFCNNSGSAGVILGTSASIQFTNCTFEDHIRIGDAIMTMQMSSTLILLNSTFSHNTNAFVGSIVYAIYNSVIFVISCEFVDNHALAGGVFYGQAGSKLVIKESSFVNNSASDGGVAHLYDCTLILSDTEISYSVSKNFGGILNAAGSFIEIRNSQFYSNAAVYGGCFSLFDDTSLLVYNSIFENNSAREGGVIHKTGTGNVSLENCTLGYNEGSYGGAIFYHNSDYLRLSKGFCSMEFRSGINCITFECEKGEGNKCGLLTYDYTISNGNKTINSKFDKDFFLDAKRLGMIYVTMEGNSWLETPYASLAPVTCRAGNKCVCSYVKDEANVCNCSSRALLSLSEAFPVLNNTNWLNLSTNKIKKLCEQNLDLTTISKLNLANNNLTSICDDTLNKLFGSNLQVFDLRNNSLSTLPEKIANFTSLTEMWLSGNPFVCNCSMIWMKQWMDNYNKSGNRVIKDYVNVSCSNGQLIHTLDPVTMGCFPEELTLWQKLIIILAVIITIVTSIAILAINRRLEEVKWFMYLHFDILDKKDGDENLQNKESDALISYSEADEEIMREIFMKYDGFTPVLEEDYGFKLTLHQRDFMAGVTIANNIVRAVTGSRRMIMLLSRNYIDSDYCMEEFKIAHHIMTKENKKYLMVVFLEPLDVDALPRDLKTYLRTYTYIDARKQPRDIAILRKRIVFGLPRQPLSKLKDNDDVEEENVAGDNDDEADELRVPEIREARPLLTDY